MPRRKFLGVAAAGMAAIATRRKIKPPATTEPPPVTTLWYSRYGTSGGEVVGSTSGIPGIGFIPGTGAGTGATVTGQIDVTTTGNVYNDLHITDSVYMWPGSSATFNRCKFTADGTIFQGDPTGKVLIYAATGIANGNTDRHLGLTLNDCDISGGCANSDLTKGAQIGFRGYAQANRCQFHHAATVMQTWQNDSADLCEFNDCWFHDSVGPGGGLHADTCYIEKGDHQRFNRCYMDSQYHAGFTGLFIRGSGGPTNDVVWDSGWFNGAEWEVAMFDPVTNSGASNSLFFRTPYAGAYYANGGFTAPIHSGNATDSGPYAGAAGAVWTNNRWIDTLATIPFA